MSSDRFTYVPQRRSRRRAVVIVALVTALSLSGIALANWLTSGSGSGRTHAGAMLSLNVNPADITVNGYLTPGGDGDLGFSVQNPNHAPVTITSVSQGAGDFTFESNGGNAGACQLSLNSSAFQTLNGAVIPAQDVRTFQVAGAVHMGAGADSFCQNQSFTVPIVVTASS
jgi:hypothetical protein